MCAVVCMYAHVACVHMYGMCVYCGMYMFMVCMWCLCTWYECICCMCAFCVYEYVWCSRMYSMVCVYSVVYVCGVCIVCGIYVVSVYVCVRA